MAIGDFSLPDLFDANEGLLSAADAVFRDFGGTSSFAGPIRTIKCHEDNSLVAMRLREPGEGSVLVVDGGGSLRCALVGDNLVAAAIENGWAGVVVYGCVRDVKELAEMPLGVKALASNPLRSIKRDTGERDLAVSFAGVRFVPDAWLYADANGIGVTPMELSLPS